jgi:hypothetical protein
MKSSIKGALKFCALYFVYAALMLTVAYFSSDERTSELLNLLVWWPSGVVIFGVMWLFGLQRLPVESGIEMGMLLAAVSAFVVFLVGFVFTAIKTRMS